MKNKDLKRRIRGRLLAGAPKDQLEANMWEAIGYKQLPTGDWYEPEEPFGPSLEFIRRYPHGHVCRACRDHFRSTNYHDAFCSSCRAILKDDRERIDAIFSATKGKSDNDGQNILHKIKLALACPRCGWQANEGRMESTNIERIREYVGDWIITAHIHWMRHNFWNRFANKPNFLSRKEWEQELQARKAFADLAGYARKNPNLIEITFSGDRNPLSAVQIH